MNRMIGLVAMTAALAPAAWMSCEAKGEVADESAPAAEVAADGAVQKRTIRKKDEYSCWDEAVKVAESWDQPIIAFIELKGDKASSKVRMNTFAKKDEFLKAFVNANAVYYHYAIPQVESKQNGAKGGNNRGKKQETPPKPDFTAVRESEQMIVRRIAAGGEQNKASLALLPVVAVVTTGGQVLGRVTYEEGPTPLATFVNEISEILAKGNFKNDVGSKLQKLIDAEAKKAAKQKK